MSRSKAEVMVDEAIEPNEVGRVPLEQLLTQSETINVRAPRITGVVVGAISGVARGSAPLVDFEGNSAGRLVSARSAIAIRERDIGRTVALMFEDGDPNSPIVIGFIETIGAPAVTPARTVVAEADRERVVISAESELVLCCGDASITLTNTGKVTIRGSSLLSRASGVNRIKGGSVQIN